MNNNENAVIIVEQQKNEQQKKKIRKPRSDTFFAGLNELVEDRVLDAISKLLPTKHEYLSIDNTAIAPLTDRQHWMFPLALTIVRSKVPLYIWGNASFGKSTLSYNIAKALGLDPVIVSCNRDSTAGTFFGYPSVNNNGYIPGLLYDAYKTGKLVILEEFDSPSPGVRLALNNLIANSYYTFPNCETVEKHKDFRIIATGNTLGLGATQQYNARQSQDLASIDRFCYLELPLDESLEASIVGINNATLLLAQDCQLDSGGVLTPEEWLVLCRKYRQAFRIASLPDGVSTRSILMGVKLSLAGIGKEWLVKMLITKTLSPEQSRKLTEIFNTL